MPKARVLVVEDSRVIAMELEDRLKSLGYRLEAIVSSGEEAIEEATRARPDLVLMDIKLRGEVDGIEATTAIRADLDIPVVYLTAYADEDTLRRAKITEPYGYILKPFEERELHTAIEMALYKHKMEKRLRESERWLATTLTSIDDGVIATDESGWVVFMNSVAGALTGWPQSEVQGRRITEIFEVIHENERAIAANPAMQALKKGETVDLSRHYLVTKGGGRIPIEGRSALIQDGGGTIRGVVLTFRDVSKRKREEEERERLQEQLFQAQQTEAVGLLAGGLAHDYSNLMMTIVGYSSLMLADLDPEDALYEEITHIQEAGERAATLTRQILALSRQQMPEPQVLDLNGIIVQMEKTIRRLAGKHTTVVQVLEPDFGYIKADPGQLEQLIINLVLNAKEAMPEGGEIAIKTENVTLDENQIDQRPGAYPGTFVRLSISDSGSGIDDEVLPQVFEPFFSTRETSSGLGLSIVQNTVQQCDGWIEIDSEIGRGSTFHIFIPVFWTDLKEPPTVEVQPEMWGRGERILLVEDNTRVRAAISEMLRAGGYNVLQAADTGEAIEIFEQEKGEVHMVFADVVLPNRNGIQLVDQLHTRAPGLPVLLTSGYTDQQAQWPAIRERGFRFLQKPFSLNQLLPTVREVLTGQAASASGHTPAQRQKTSTQRRQPPEAT